MKNPASRKAGLEIPIFETRRCYMVVVWVWFGDGPVRVRVGKRPVVMSYSEETDEGWASERLEIRREGKYIVCERAYDGRDCDGRLQTGSVCEWRPRWGRRVSRATPMHPRDLRFPQWRERSHTFRDHTAERMGY